MDGVSRFWMGLFIATIVWFFMWLGDAPNWATYGISITQFHIVYWGGAWRQ